MSKEGDIMQLMKKNSIRSNICWVLLLLLLLMMVTGCAKRPSETEASTSSESPVTATQTPTEPTAPPELEFPFMLEDGALEISSAFQYSGPNPDCGWEEKENIGALVLVNRSDKYLTETNITVTLSNEETLQFAATDIPPGQTVWVFESENKVFSPEEQCIAAEGEAKFSDDTGLSADEVTAEAQSIALTLTNNTDSDMKDLTVRCHILFDGVYFGGTAYSYPVEAIPAGGNVIVEAMDCFLGDAAAVWIGTR